MALQTPAGTPPASRKIRRLGIAVVIVVALYSVGWFVVASKIETYLEGVLSGAGPVDIACPGLATAGFPFLIGFTCDKIDVRDSSDGNVLTAGALRVAARIYSPGSAVVELDSPANVSLSDGSALSAQWSSMRSSFSVGLSSLKTFSASGENVALDYLSDALHAALQAKASHGEVHLRGNGNDLEAAFLARNLALGAEGVPEPILPALSTSAQLTVEGKAELLEGRPLIGKAMKGQLGSFRIEMPDGLFGEMSGPYEIDDEGYLSGEFKTRFEKIDLWQKHLLRLFPEGEGTISGLAALLRGLAKDGQDVTVNLVVRKGTLSLSMVPLARIPPI
jgi:hypothetical protein